MIPNKIKEFLNRAIVNKQPQPKSVYAVTTGTYAGELIVYIESNNSHHNFLALPKMENREIPCEKFEFGLNNKIIEQVKKLPSNVFSVCKLQHTKNKLSASAGIRS
jgi:hypothetical protein